MNTRLKFTLKLLFTITLFYLLFFHLTDIDKVIKNIKKADIWYLISAAVILIFSVMISAFRWKKLLDIKKLKVSYLTAAKEYFIGAFFNNFLPSSIGGDFSRVVGIAKITGRKTDLFSSVIIERIIGFIALLIIGNTGIFMLKIGDNQYIPMAALLFTITVVLIFAVLISRRLNKKICRIIEKLLPVKIGNFIINLMTSFNTYSQDKKKLITTLFISLFFRITEGLFVYFITLSLGVEISYIYTLVLFATISVIKFLPISINGFGLSAVSWIYLTKSANIDSDLATSLDFLIITTSLIVSLLGGFFYIFSKNIPIKKDIK